MLPQFHTIKHFISLLSILWSPNWSSSVVFMRRITYIETEQQINKFSEEMQVNFSKVKHITYTIL